MLLGLFQAEGERRKLSLIVAQRQGTQKEKENILLPLGLGETSFKDKELRQASELQLRDRGGRQPLAIRQKESRERELSNMIVACPPHRG